MRKLMMLAAMVAMVMLVAAPAMADTVLRSTAQIDQSNDGSQYAINDADQDATASQFQYQPGGDATDDDSEDIDIEDVDIDVNLGTPPKGGGSGGSAQPV
jgi:hypothetical protein